MKTIRLAAFALALSALFVSGKAAMAAQVNLVPNQVFIQMSQASGVASIDTKAGIVKVTVKNLPLDPSTHKPLPIMLQDIGTIPAMVKQTKTYQVYLLRIDETA